MRISTSIARAIASSWVGNLSMHFDKPTTILSSHEPSMLERTVHSASPVRRPRSRQINDARSAIACLTAAGVYARAVTMYRCVSRILMRSLQHGGCPGHLAFIPSLPRVWVSQGSYPLAMVRIHESQVPQMPSDVELGWRQERGRDSCQRTSRGTSDARPSRWLR